MKRAAFIFSMFICLGTIKAQEVDTCYLRVPISKNDTIVYKRIVQFDKKDCLYHVRDYFPNGQIQDAGHWMDSLVYPGQELYDWFLKHDKRNKN